MPIYFFDTSALQHRYIDGPYSKRIRRIISTGSNECFIADITVLEIASGLGRRCRQGNLRYQRYDQADDRFWKDVADGNLIVRATTQRDVMRARTLLRFAGVLRRRNLGSSDALIAVTCLELALERQKPIIFYTSDWTQFDVLRQIDAFNAVLTLRLAGTPKA
ncbi:MAG TPA: type II toxin-antitoxin system VapC family toxin [Pyrinomonadaceae bacterium]|nr:type II toxin-antitoxin system VapC family toxin [Pyrinomonadaceae bacterium]